MMGLMGTAPCAENDEINVLAIGASQLMSNSLPLPKSFCRRTKWS